MPNKLTSNTPTDYFILNNCPSKRPCKKLDCRHHLAIVWDNNGCSSPIFPDVGLRELPETCVLDVANRYNGLTLEDIGVLLGITPERVRQIEFKALRKIKKDMSVVVKQEA